MSLKDTWKETGESLGNAFEKLGKTVVKTVAAGVKKAEEWANEETAAKEAASGSMAEQAPKNGDKQ